MSTAVTAEALDLSKYRKDARGALIPIENIRPIDLTRDELVLDIVEGARQLSSALAEFKAKTFSDIEAFVELSVERYDAKVGGDKGNLTLISFDGRYKVQRAVQETLSFDEGLQAAKSLIDECLTEWTEGARSELKVIVSAAFEVDAKGAINTRRVLSLRRFDIKDGRWKRAMEALSDSLRVQCSKSYVRVYERVGDTNEYRSIALDVAGV